MNLENIVYQYYENGEKPSITFEDKKLRWMFSQVLKVCDELNSFNIQTGDIVNWENWGKKGNELAMFDLGYGKEKNVDFPLLEAISPAMEKIFKALHIENYKWLGSGHNGHAYSIDGNRVLKLTTDVTEANNAKKLIGKQCVHLANVYNVYKLKEREGMYITICERLPIPNEIETLGNQLEKYVNEL